MQKLNGKLNLSAIPKELIFTDNKGNKCIYIDVLANINGEDKYGNTHTVTVYDKNARKSVYLANLKKMEVGGSAQTQAQAPAAAPQAGQGPEDDLPFS